MATTGDDGDRQETDGPKSRAEWLGRKRFQFSLGLLFMVATGLGALLAFILHYPTLAIVLATITLGVILVGGFCAVLLAEAMFEDWLASKLNSDRKSRAEKNDN